MSPTTRSRGDHGGGDEPLIGDQAIEWEHRDLIEALRAQYLTPPSEPVVARHLSELRSSRQEPPVSRWSRGLTRAAAVTLIVALGTGAAALASRSNGPDVVSVELAGDATSTPAPTTAETVPVGNDRAQLEGASTSASSATGAAAGSSTPTVAGETTAEASASTSESSILSTTSDGPTASSPGTSGPLPPSPTTTTTTPPPTTVPPKTVPTASSTAPPSRPSTGATCAGLVATIVGTDGDDVLVGTEGTDVIVGREGDDYIDGRGGDDTICGENGKDELYGGGGDDYIDGGNGKDRLVGGGGVDKLIGGNGSNEIIQDDQ